MSLFRDGTTAFVRCQSIDGTIRTDHYYRNQALGAPFGRPFWVCVNCGLPR